MRRSVRYWIWAGVVAFLLLFEANVIGRAPSQSNRLELRHATEVFEFRSGVIVDSTGPAVYLMNPAGGIDAVDLSSGKLLWRTTRAAKPLLLDGRRLVTQAEFATPDSHLRLHILDARDGGRELLEATVQLPEHVQVGIDDGLGASFRTSARLHEDKVIVSWKYSWEEIGGARAGPDHEVRVTAGAVRVDLQTGHADTLAPDEVVSVPEGQVPDPIARLIEPGTLRGPLWQVGGVLAGLERRRDDGGWRTVLRRWRADTGQPLPEAVLFGDELTFRYTSANGAHLLASQRLQPADAGWVWKIYSLEAGEEVAEVHHRSPAAWFFIAASSLIFEAPPKGRVSEAGLVMDQPFRLRAIGLTTSEELWEWPFRDTAYRGPYPPTRPGGSRRPWITPRGRLPPATARKRDSARD